MSTVIKNLLAEISHAPGVYKMLNAKGDVIYVGKAKDLKKRLSSYFFASKQHDAKTEALVVQIANIETIITGTENEALLLENTLIKEYWPRYNVLFKDDKSYPYLFLSKHDFPRLTIHRGTQNLAGEYFGPFCNVGSIRDTLGILQKIFRLRQCGENFFRNRTRPCIQYQIKRCAAPCVGYIDSATYMHSVNLVRKFLSGKNTQIIQDLQSSMSKAAQQQAYEIAAHYRDQITSLQKIQQQQYVIKKDGSVDAFAFTSNASGICIGVVSIRNGLVLGTKTYLQEVAVLISKAAILESFISQYYLALKVSSFGYPKKIVVNEKLPDRDWLQLAISTHLQHKLHISDTPRGIYEKWITMAKVNADHVLQKHYAAQANYFRQLETFQTVFKLPNLPRFIDCFDVSHTQGEATVVACVVFGETGPIKNMYRRFNITDGGGDDYAALENALLRRYVKLKTENKTIPDVLLIDGGQGQLNVAKKVLTELQIDSVFLLAIAKGITRKPGLEEIYTQNHHEPIIFDPAAPALHFLQQVRDEAHRFAITAQRKKLAKGRRVSILENISGIGKKRRETLLKYFGGLQKLKSASIDEIAKIPGMKTMAKVIYNYLHEKNLN